MSSPPTPSDGFPPSPSDAPGSGPYFGDDSRGGMGVGDILRILRLRAAVVAGVAAAILAATALLVRSEEPMYRAVSVIRLADARRALTSGLEELEASPERLLSPLLSQVQLLRSRTLAGHVVDAAGLRLRPDFTGFSSQLLSEVRVDVAAQEDSIHLRFAVDGVHARTSRDSTSAAYGAEVRLGGVQFVVAAQPETETSVWAVQTREQAIDALLENLRITPRPQTNVVDIVYTSRRRIIAQQVANTVAERFQALSATAAREQSQRRRIFLEDQLRRSDSALLDAQMAQSEHRRRAAVYSSRSQLESKQRELQRLEIEAEELGAERRTYASLIAALQDSSEDRRHEAVRALIASPGVGSNPGVTQTFALLTRHRAALDSLTTGEWRSAETNPDVQRLRRLIQSTEDQLVAAVRSRMTILDAQLQALEVSHARTVASLQALPDREAEELRLAQGVETHQRLGEQLRADFQKSLMLEAVEVGPVEIVDRASLPVAPAPRLRGLKLALGLVFGIGLGGTLAVLLEMRGTMIRRQDEVETFLRLPSLALIPKIESNGAAAPRRAAQRIARALGAPSNGVESTTASGAARLLAGSAVPSAPTEAYRVLRTNLLFSRGASALRSIAVTSAAPGEGKTTVAANLAVSFAREGMRVVLVDCDLRRARLHRLFGVRRDPGMSQVLLDQEPSVVIRTTAVDGLFLLTGGAAEDSSADLLGSIRMRNVMRSLTERFDVVVLDTPPVLALADASIVAALADVVLLVVRAGRTPRTVAQQALLQLGTVRARVVGAVLNDPSGSLPEYLRYYSAYEPAGS